MYYAEATLTGITKYNKSVIKYIINKENTEEECIICNEKLKKKKKTKYATLKCGHSFHNKCFQKWIKTQHEQGQVATCPICRYGKSPDDEKIKICKNTDRFSHLTIDNDSYSYYSDSD